MKKLQLLLFFFVSITVSILLVSPKVDGRKSLLQKEGRDDSNKLVEQSTTLDADFHGEMVGNNQKKKLPTDLEDNPEDQKGENSEDEKGSEEDVPGDEEGESEEAGDDGGESGSTEGEYGDLGDCGEESGGPKDCGAEFGDDDGGAFEGDEGEAPGEESGEVPEYQGGGGSGEEVSRDNNGEDSEEKVPGDN
ncbi:hypothetical protein E5676_scaffold447G00230 [Cucumis melo var. makuwa]|uniref:Uncharacterized protein n=1 Tax=Cucumis melo var. makuwa TaxID=1194695 RepID=A0A5D3CEH4_CUCMM|nr:hypothetical protein E5676_scaffold447G00230 [Cucumis melo var. makuwa]